MFVEGVDDQRFCRVILYPVLRKIYEQIEIVPYSQTKKKTTNVLIKVIRSEWDTDYLVLADRDVAPCVTIRKQLMLERFPEAEEDKIIVVVPEIESWYLAGLDERSSRKLGIPFSIDCERVTKEMFDSYKNRQFTSRIDWIEEILSCYSIDWAQQRCRSLRRFIRKHCC